MVIGQLSRRAGVPPKTIRYYEEVGILPAPARGENGYRIYSELDLRRVELVRRARALEMTLPEMKDLVEWAGSQTCDSFQTRLQEVVHRKLQELDQRMADLQHLRYDLEHLEAHLSGIEEQAEADCTVLECSPGTCRCMGDLNG